MQYTNILGFIKGVDFNVIFVQTDIAQGCKVKHRPPVCPSHLRKYAPLYSFAGININVPFPSLQCQCSRTTEPEAHDIEAFNSGSELAFLSLKISLFG